MKTVKLTLSVLLLFLLTGLLTSAYGQEAEKKVHITVIKNGETTVDTSFSAGDMNQDQLHKEIEAITGESSEKKEMQYVVIKKGEGHPDKDIDIQVGDDTLHINRENVFVIHTDEKGDVHWTEDSKDRKNEKKIIVKVLSDKEDVDATNPQNNVKVIVLDDENGTIFVNHNVKVVKTDEKNNEIEVTIETEKESKTKTSKEIGRAHV